MDSGSAWCRRFAAILERGRHQCVLDLARRLVGVTPGDVDGHVRSAKGAAEVGDVPFYFPKVEALFTIRQTLLHRARLDVVKGDSVQNVLRRIPKHDNGGASRLPDNFPVVAQEPTRRQRNDAIAAVLPSENVLQDSRRRAAKTVRRQVTASKTFDRCFEEALGLEVKVEKTILKQASQSRAYRGLAYTADSSEEYAHVATFGESCATPGRARDNR